MIPYEGITNSNPPTRRIVETKLIRVSVPVLFKLKSTEGIHIKINQVIDQIKIINTFPVGLKLKPANNITNFSPKNETVIPVKTTKIPIKKLIFLIRSII